MWWFRSGSSTGTSGGGRIAKIIQQLSGSEVNSYAASLLPGPFEDFLGKQTS